MTNNLRYAIRAIVRARGYAATVILTLGVGIGANAAVFSTIDAVLLKPLPVPDADRLVRVREVNDTETVIAPVRLHEWAARSTAFEALTGYFVEDVSDTTGALPERARRAVVAPRFLDVWRVRPAVGRDFTDAESRVGGPAAVLISTPYWRMRLGADPNVLQRVVRIEGTTYAIAGVMPETFRFPDRTVDFWWPYPVDGADARNTPQNRTHRWYTGVGRLRAGVTPEQAQANLATIQARLGEEYPDTDAGMGARVVPFKQTLIGGVQDSLWLLYGAVSVLLLIACTNIAALQVSRASRRAHEMAIRFALGASRRTVIGQLLTETALLTFAGAALGLIVATGAAAVIQTLAPDLPRREEIGIDARMLIYTLASAAVVALGCGVLPALRSTRDALAISSSGRTQVSGRHALQWMFVGVQMALSITLLAAAGLLVRSVDALSRVGPGFDASRVLALRVSGSWAETADPAALAQRIDGTLARLRALPGVEMAATSWSLPGVPRRYETTFELAEGRAASEPPLVAEWRSVSPDYFRTLRIALAAGEGCRQSRQGQRTDVLVNRAFTQRYFRDRSIIGSHLRWEADTQVGRVVGVVGNTRDLGLDREPAPTVYACDAAPSPFPWFLVRTQGEPAALAATVRSAMKEIEPLRSVYDVAPLAQRIGDAYEHTQVRMALLLAFAATALSLACLGVYGTLSYAVSLRRREVSLRLALGAMRGQIVRQIVWQACRVIGIACVCGLALSAGLNRALTGMLYGVSPSDPVTLAAVVAIVVAAGVLAALVPAVRATFVQPMRVLREE